MFIIRILLGLIQAILKTFVDAFVLLFSTAITTIAVLAAMVVIALALTGTISLGLFRRNRK